jgi:hypothetical protein
MVLHFYLEKITCVLLQCFWTHVWIVFFFQNEYVVFAFGISVQSIYWLPFIVHKTFVIGFWKKKKYAWLVNWNLSTYCREVGKEFMKEFS